ncbi:hypothetical protein CLPU_15c00030 [Gottschalkia purinilytica]|uniref:Yip1 domain-containing protein n=1 Tax=Gottschalkia purinilytica TaxID=1503 RepID=A0A0L0W7L6_GOTPU|nr:Yip1 family protein [Gottschalkia purinilytica]KNF07509.1 hypothetical protein CLPU_15c00030 [Gottschalkia purinilytica]
MKFLNKFIGMIYRPKEVLREVNEKPSILESLILIVVIPLIYSLFFLNEKILLNTINGTGDMSQDVIDMVDMRGFFTLFMIFAIMFLSPIGHFITTSIYHLLAEFFGYEGKGKNLFVTLAYAGVPSLILGCIHLVAMYFNNQILGLIISIASMIWSIVLSIFAIGETYKMGGGKSCLLYFIPVIIICAFIGLFIGIIATVAITMFDPSSLEMIRSGILMNM